MSDRSNLLDTLHRPEIVGLLSNNKNIDHTLIQKKITEFKNRAMHWRGGHYEASRFYQKLEWTLGVPSVVLSTVVLSLAFYTVGRNDVGIFLQYGLAITSVLQAIFVALQTYIRPAILTEAHRISAIEFGNIMREYELLEITINREGVDATYELNEIMENSAAISATSRPLPSWIVNPIKKSLNLP